MMRKNDVNMLGRCFSLRSFFLSFFLRGEVNIIAVYLFLL